MTGGTSAVRGVSTPFLLFVCRLVALVGVDSDVRVEESFNNDRSLKSVGIILVSIRGVLLCGSRREPMRGDGHGSFDRAVEFFDSNPTLLLRTHPSDHNGSSTSSGKLQKQNSDSFYRR